MTGSYRAAPPHDAGSEGPEPAPLRRLRLLVTALILVLIAGVVTIVATLVIRLGSVELGSGAPELAPLTAERLSLPRDATVRAVGRSGDEILLVVSRAGGVEELRRYAAADGSLLSVTPILRSDQTTVQPD